MEAAYSFLRATPPFKGWKLPEADDVGFHVVRDPKMYADFGMESGLPVIRVSEAKNGHVATLLATMGHEMIHLRQELIGAKDAHGESFKRMAAAVCRAHGFDIRAF